MAYLDEFGAVHGVQPFEVDDHAIGRTLSNMLVPPWPSGIVQASPFKKVASFVCSFVYEKPIVTKLPVNCIPVNGQKRVLLTPLWLLQFVVAFLAVDERIQLVTLSRTNFDITDFLVQ